MPPCTAAFQNILEFNIQWPKNLRKKILCELKQCSFTVPWNQVLEVRLKKCHKANLVNVQFHKIKTNLRQQFFEMLLQIVLYNKIVFFVKSVL